MSLSHFDRKITGYYLLNLTTGLSSASSIAAFIICTLFKMLLFEMIFNQYTTEKIMFSESL